MTVLYKISAQVKDGKAVRKERRGNVHSNGHEFARGGSSFSIDNEPDMFFPWQEVGIFSGEGDFGMMS